MRCGAVREVKLLLLFEPLLKLPTSPAWTRRTYPAPLSRRETNTNPSRTDDAEVPWAWRRSFHPVRRGSQVGTLAPAPAETRFAYDDVLSHAYSKHAPSPM